MNKLKFIVCIIINILLFSFAIIGYNQISGNKDVVKTQNPVTVRILDITYRAKSQSTCNVEFDNKTYYNVGLPSEAKINNINKKDFYYDTKRNVVFYKKENFGSIYVVFGLSFLSLLLWLIPSKKFNW